MNVKINRDEVSDLIRQAAETYILPRYKALEDHEVFTKTTPNDLVTQADIEAEAFLIERLEKLAPGSIAIGEEVASRNPSCLGVLQNQKDVIWVIDPVDGTHNFVHHRREFGVMVACVVGGQTRHAWIYDILGNAMATAESGQGAYLNNEPLKVETENNASEMSGHINPRFFPKSYQEGIKESRNRFKLCNSLHCAAHEYLNLAKGLSQFSLYSRLKPWDHLAGSLIVTEAGGHVATWKSEAYRPSHQDIGLIVAADSHCWQTAYDIFLKPYAENPAFG